MENTTFREEGGMVRIFFPSIPDKATRDMIKARGFRWNGSAWTAPASQETVRTAKELSSISPANSLPEDAPALDIVEAAAEAEDPVVAISAAAGDRLGDIIAFIRWCHEREERLREEKKRTLEAVAPTLGRLEDEEKEIAARRLTAEKAVVLYLNSAGEESTAEGGLVAKIRETRTYGMTDEFAKDVERKVAAMRLPDWLRVSVRPDTKKLDAAGFALPYGASVTATEQTLSVFPEDEFDRSGTAAEQTIEAFRNGIELERIAQMRGVGFKQTAKYIKDALRDGTMDIHEVASDELLDKMVRLHNDHPEWKLDDYVASIQSNPVEHRIISYDSVYLAMCYLGLYNA